MIGRVLAGLAVWAIVASGLAVVVGRRLKRSRKERW